LVEWLEARKAGFVVVARLTGPIKRRLAHLRYTSPSRGVEVAEFSYQPTRWRRSYRFVVIRRPQPEEPTEQLTLFKLGRYHYQVLVTNFSPCNRSTSGASTTTVLASNCSFASSREIMHSAVSPAITSWPTKPTST
jgi:hypothetical protein